VIVKQYNCPRIKIDMDEQFKVMVYEDVLDGLHNTEFDVESY
jgi:hypothetical protein